MTALAHDRMGSFERWTDHLFRLAVGNKAWKGGACGIDLSTGKVEPMHAETDLLYIGTFAKTVDATSAEQDVLVDLGIEIELRWWANDTGSPAAASDLGSLCYFLDDQTVTLDPTGHSLAGRIWAVDSTWGVLVQKLEAVPANVSSLDGLGAVVTTPPAYASNDLIIPNNPNSGAIYDIPTTSAASTVTLPATATDGDILYFRADGTKNGHTVQYRDATGPVNLTTALTASKRHQVAAIFLSGKWTANAYVSP